MEVSSYSSGTSAARTSQNLNQQEILIDQMGHPVGLHIDYAQRLTGNHYSSSTKKGPRASLRPTFSLGLYYLSFVIGYVRGPMGFSML